MSHKRQLISGLIALVLVGVPRVASAQDEAMEMDALEAKQNTALGKQYARQGAVRRALPYFERAYELKRSYITAANLGTAELKMKRYRLAANHLSEALQQVPAERLEALKKLRGYLSEAKQHVVTLSINVEPDRSIVYLDGEVLGVAPLSGPVFVDAGTHILYAQNGDDKTKTQMVAGAAGSSQGVNLVVLARSPETNVPHSTPSRGEGVAADADGGDSLLMTTLLVGGGITLTSLGVSVGLTVWANDLSSEADELVSQVGVTSCTNASGEVLATCNTISELRGDQDTASNAAFGMWLATGALALTTAGIVAGVALLPEKGSSAATTIAVAPMPLPGGGGLVLVGTW